MLQVVTYSMSMMPMLVTIVMLTVLHACQSYQENPSGSEHHVVYVSLFAASGITDVSFRYCFQAWAAALLYNLCMNNTNSAPSTLLTWMACISRVCKSSWYHAACLCVSMIAKCSHLSRTCPNLRFHGSQSHNGNPLCHICFGTSSTAALCILYWVLGRRVHPA
jgi:hypothetical protein